MRHTLQKQRKVEQGVAVQSDDSYTIYDGNVTLYKENGDVLAKLIKRALPDNMVEAGRQLLRYKSSSNSRGFAAGINEARKKAYGDKGGLALSNVVKSSTVGYYEKNGFYKCRQTSIYRKNLDSVDKVSVPLLEYISDLFQKHAPQQYERQKGFVEKINQNMRLGQSVFTTFTVNVDFRTMTHYDKGDFASGLGNLCVFNVGDFKGAELLLPEYLVGLKIEEGDLLLFDVHELHCNNPIEGAGRISLVCYAREKILGRCDGLSAEEIVANSSDNVTQRHRKKK